MYDPSDALCLIVGDIWRSMFASDAIAVTGFEQALGGEAVGAAVTITGGWDGQVLLRCSPALAAGLAGAMFDPGAAGDPDSVRDAVGEVVNMIAGNLKTLLPGPCRLSLPSAHHGGPPAEVFSSGPVAPMQAFRCDGEVFTVTVVPSAGVAAA